jgi:MFS family permease
MSLTDVMLLQAMFGAAVVLLEFPSGYLADRIGYRTSLLVGGIFWGAGWIAYAGGTTFGAMVVAEITLGAGSAFISGADRALLWTSLEAAGCGRHYTRWDGRLRAAAQVSEALTSAVGGWLYARAPRLPFWLEVPATVVGFGAVLAMREPPRRPSAEHRSHLVRSLHIVRFTLWRQRRLQGAIALSVALGLSSFVMVWLIQPYMQSHGIPTVWFGPLWALAHVWLAAVSLVSARIVMAFGRHATLLGCCLLIPLGYAGLAMSTSAWGVVFYLCFMTLRGLQGPILATAMQEDAPGEDRASVLSLAALLFRLAFIAVGPLIGALADRAGLDATLGVMGVLFTVAALAALGLFAQAHRPA